MALRPGPGAGGGGGSGSGSGSFIYPVGTGIGPSQGMMPMQQQPHGFPIVPMMQPGMQNMMGVGFSSQIPQTALIQGGMPMGPMQATGMPFMGQSAFLGMRPPTQQFIPDMQKQFVEEQQKRFEQQQKMLEEERKRRQFEEQKQKLRLLSSVKPKTCERSRDDALEAIKGNLDGFSRDAKMHPTPVLHAKKADFPTSSHSSVSVSSHSSLLGADEEFSDFVQGPVKMASSGDAVLSVSSCASGHVGQILSEQAVTVSHHSPVRFQASTSLHGTNETLTVLSTSPDKCSAQKRGLSMEDTVLTFCAISPLENKNPDVLPHVKMCAPLTTTSPVSPSFLVNKQVIVGGYLNEPVHSELNTDSEHGAAVEDSVGVGLFPATDPIQQLPSWIYNDSLIPDLYKMIFESCMTPTGIDTAKLYPILMSSGLPRETLGQIWALANRTTPGKLTKEELYTVLAMIAITQRGGSALSTDVLNQLSSAPAPALSGFPMSLSSTVNQLHMAQTGSAAPRPVNIAPPVVSLNRTTQHTVMHPLPTQQCGKSEDDDFQDFQDASKSGPIDISFSDFHSDVSVKSTTSQAGIIAPPMLTPMSGTAETVSASSDKYAVFKSINIEKSSENTSTFADFEDKYHAFRELEKPPQNKTLGDGFADIKSGADDGFTDFKTADSISPLDPPAKDSHFPSQFTTVQQKSSTQTFNVAELDPFSSTVNPFPFTATFPSNTSASSSVLPFPSSSSSSLSASSFKTSSVPDDFGDFSLFGQSASAGSIGSQNDFADFMAFNSDTSSLEQTNENKPKANKPEPSPLGPQTFPAHATQAMQPAPSAADKYDIFKQLSLENSGVAHDESKYTIPSMRNDDDFADFKSDKFTIADTGSERSFVDKIASFKHAKEDSASVKSLDLPSIGGSSVGKEDSEDALSIQFDMKLADVGGDLKHVMSDSCLDLPSVSSPHPPAADEFKSASDRDGSALNTLTSLDWPEKDNIINQNKRHSDFFLGPEGSTACTSTSIFQKKETSFGSSENITMTTVSKVTTFSNEDYLQEADVPGGTSVRLFAEDPSSDFFRNDVESSCADFERGSEIPSCATGIKSADNFGEFQREKPKTSKFDFLMATTHGKVKSSEEMIKSELATLDLSAQGSHKRSLSLGDKEISRSSPAPDQHFRDRSNTLSEKPVLPVIRDKYKDLTGEMEESERYSYEWQRCLESALQVIKKANDTLNGISSSSVCTEVIQSAQGMEYLLGVVEVYRVTKRVELGIKAAAVCSEKLQHLLKETDKVWNNLISFMSLASLMPDESALDFTSCVLRPGIKNAQELACGVCLLNVDSRSKTFNSEKDNFKLSYGGHQYHASCANFWINCVEPKPPGLFLPDLL